MSNRLALILANKAVFEADYKLHPDLYLEGTWVVVKDLRLVAKNISYPEAKVLVYNNPNEVCFCGQVLGTKFTLWRT